MRADSGFFAQELLGFLEQRALPDLLVAKLTQTIKRQASGILNWTEMDADYAVGKFFAKLQIGTRTVVLWWCVNVYAKPKMPWAAN